MDSRMNLWMSKGVGLAWMIDPTRKPAIIYRPEREPEVLQELAILRGEGPVAGFELEMKRFWA